MGKGAYSYKGYDFGEVTGRIIKAAIEVHRNLGVGFQEIIYQRALALEFQAQGLDFSREVKVPIYYRGQHIGTKRVDFVVEDCMVEVKAKHEFEPQDFIQTLSYLKASGYELALLLNFGSAKIGIKRFINDQPGKYRQD